MTKEICSCLQIARAFGASDIIAVDIQDDKLLKAKIFGATHTINAKKEDPIERIRVSTFSCVFEIYESLLKCKTGSALVKFVCILNPGRCTN